MARRPRIIIEGQPHHVVQRGHNREAVFFEKEDYRLYLAALETAATRYDCGVHAYCLMSNHVHLLVTPYVRSTALSSMMQMVGRLYVREINRKYKRSGTLWEDRFKISLIDADDYLLSCMRYIELNPVRARMVRKPENYPWSSYHANGLGRMEQMIKHHPLYAALGKTDMARGREYRSLFGAVADKGDFEAITTAFEGNWVLGGGKFQEKIARRTKQRTAPSPRGGDRRSGKYLKISRKTAS